jgi:hypothetical protein
MQQLYDQGKLIWAGPFLDNSGRMTIVSVSSEEDLRQILASEQQPWRVFPSRDPPLVLIVRRKARSLIERQKWE